MLLDIAAGQRSPKWPVFKGALRRGESQGHLWLLKALVEADIYVGGNPLQPPETGTTVRLKDEKRRLQDALRGYQGAMGDSQCSELPSLAGCTNESYKLTDTVASPQRSRNATFGEFTPSVLMAGWGI